MIPALLLTLTMFGAADTPTTPVDSTQMLTLLGSGNPAVETACESYHDLTGTMYDFITAAGGDSQTLDVFTTVVDSYLVVTVEGDEYRLTPEARLVFVDWLHASCSSTRTTP